MDKDKKIVFVVGMHRSGTSALARGLKAIGVELGDNLSGAAIDNEKGFWEDRKIVEINESILESVGQHWDSVAPVSIDVRDERLEGFRQKAIEYMKGACERHVVIGIKDPRLSLLLSFWIAVANELSVDYACIFSIRHPVAIAKSLARRNGMDEEVASLLTLKYWLSILQNVDVKRIVIIDFDSLLESPNSCLKFMSKYLSLTESEEVSRDVKQYANEFLDINLRHEIPSVDQIKNWEVRSGQFSLILRLYEKLKEYSCKKTRLPQKYWREYVLAYDSMSPVFPYIDLLAKREHEPRRVQIDDSSLKEGEQLHQLISGQNKELTRLNSVLDQSSENLQALHEKNSKLIEQVAKSEQRAQNSEAKENEAAQQAKRYRLAAKQLEQAVVELDQELSRLNGVVSQSSEQLQTLSDKNTKLVEQVSKSEQRVQQVESKESELVQQAERYRLAAERSEQTVVEQGLELARINGVVSQSSEQLKTLSTKNTELVEQVAKSEQRAQQIEEKERALIQQVERFRVAAERSEQTVVEQGQELARLNGVVSQSSEQLQTLSSKNIELVEEIAKSQQRGQPAEVEEDMARQAENYRSTIARLEQTVVEQGQELSRLNGVVSQSSEQLQLLSAKNTELVEDITKAQQRVQRSEAKERELAQQAERHRLAAGRSEDMVMNQGQELSRLNGVVSQSSEQLQVLSAKNTELIEEITKAQQQVKRSEAKEHELAQQAERHRLAAERSEEKVVEQGQELSRLNGVVSQSSEQLQILSAKNTELIEEITKAQQQVQRSGTKERELAQQAERHRLAAERSEEKVAEQSQELSRLNGVVSHSSEQLQTISAKNTELVELVAISEQRVQGVEDKENELACQAKEYRKTIANLEQVVAENIQELGRLNGVVSQSSEQLQTLSTKNTELVAQVAISEQRVHRSEEAKNELEQQVDSYRLAVSQSEQSVVAQGHELERLKEVVNQNNEQLKAFDNLNSQLVHSNRRMKELEREAAVLASEKLEFKLLSENLAKEGERLVGELSNRQSEEQTLRGELDRKEGVEKRLLEELSVLKQKCVDMDVALSELKDKEALLAQKLEHSVQYQSALLAYQDTLKQTLEIERHTIIRPFLRYFYKTGKCCASILPHFLKHPLRKIGHRMVSQNIVVNEVANVSPFALQSFDSGAEAVDFENEHIKEEVLNCSPSGFDVIVFPVIDWHFRIQRPQHLARFLAQKGHRVFYLSTTFGNGLPGIKILEKVEDRVFICQLNIPLPHPVIYEQVATEDQMSALRRGLSSFLGVVNSKRIVSIVDHPFWRSVAMSIQGSMLVYDCMDDHGGFSNNAKDILKEEEQLLMEADLVITTSAPLSEKIGKKRSNVLVRNAGESRWFSEAPERLAYSTDRPVIGYYGAISEWFDMGLVIKAAKAYPEYDFVLVGSTFMCDTKKAEKINNIHFTGEVPYSDLKEYLYAFDVCMIPFKLIELIQCTNPVKMYEYLAAGKPVVATNMPEVRAVKDQVFVAENDREFIYQIQQALEEKDLSEKVVARKEFAMQNQWQNRVDDLVAAIDSRYPKVSVVVLTYNNLEFTKACLHSLELFTNYPNWELVIVDNASTDGSGEYLKDYVEGKENTKLFLNEENTGFSAGNNVGIRYADGDYIVVLNNDTYVTKGWLWDLIRHFSQDRELGLVGPVTNNIGNEAKIDINYANMDEMEIHSRDYTSKQLRKRIYVNTVAFFCVAIKKEVIEQVGLLDEAFGRGFFEDDDYCIRARTAGYKVAIADDVFVHHHLSASFNQLKDTEKKKLFEANKAIYEAKWGKWVPHKYREVV